MVGPEAQARQWDLGRLANDSSLGKKVDSWPQTEKSLFFWKGKRADQGRGGWVKAGKCPLTSGPGSSGRPGSGLG